MAPFFSRPLWFTADDAISQRSEHSYFKIRSCAARLDLKNRHKISRKSLTSKIRSCNARLDLKNKSARFSGFLLIQNRARITLAAMVLCLLSRKKNAYFFFIFAWGFGIAKWRGCLVISFCGLRFLGNQARTILKTKKIRGNFGRKSGTKNSKDSGNFRSATFLA